MDIETTTVFDMYIRHMEDEWSAPSAPAFGPLLSVALRHRFDDDVRLQVFSHGSKELIHRPSDEYPLMLAFTGPDHDQPETTTILGPASIKADRIRDWIIHSMAVDAAWLHETDADGIPVKLSGPATLEDLFREADETVADLTTCWPPTEGRRPEADAIPLAGGWTLARLTSVEELEAERGLVSPFPIEGLAWRNERRIRSWFSVRDPAGAPQAILLTHPDLRLAVAIVGRCRLHRPHPDVMRALAPWLRKNVSAFRVGFNGVARGTGINKDLWWTRIVVDVHGVVHDLDDLPDHLEVEGNLAFDSDPRLRLPVTLVCRGGAFMVDPGPEKGLVVRMPKTIVAKTVATTDCHLDFTEDSTIDCSWLRLQGCITDTMPAMVRRPVDALDMSDTRCRKLPSNLATKRLRIERSQVDEIPSETLFGRLDCLASELPRLPDGMVVHRMMLNDCKAGKLPAGLRIRNELRMSSCRIPIPDDAVVEGNLYVSWSSKDGADAPALPDGLKVGGLLSLGWYPTRLPTRLHVSGDLLLYGHVHDLPDDLFVGGDLKLNGTKVAVPDGVTVKGAIVT